MKTLLQILITFILSIAFANSYAFNQTPISFSRDTCSSPSCSNIISTTNITNTAGYSTFEQFCKATWPNYTIVMSGVSTDGFFSTGNICKFKSAGNNYTRGKNPLYPVCGVDTTTPDTSQAVCTCQAVARDTGTSCTREACPVGSSHALYGTHVFSSQKLSALCVNGCQYRDAWRDFVSAGCTNTNNPFGSGVNDPQTVCSYRFFSVDGVYDYTLGSGTGEVCTQTPNNGTTSQAGDGSEFPPFDPTDTNADGETNSNDPPPPCNTPECEGGGGSSSSTCNTQTGNLTSFTCDGDAAFCANARTTAENSCVKESNGCDPSIQNCSFTPVTGTGNFSTDGMDALTATELDLLEAEFNAIKNDFAGVFTPLVQSSGSLPCPDPVFVLGKPISICLTPYSTQLAPIGAAIVFIAMALGFFIVLRV